MTKFISGTIGITRLVKNGHTIILLADNHDNQNYCNTDNIFIDKYLKDRMNDYLILLEEIPIIKAIKFKELWKTKHIKKLKDLYKNNDEIHPIDIRMLLLPFSWELYNIEVNTNQLEYFKYIEFINLFFRKESELYKQIILPNNNGQMDYYFSELKKTFYNIIRNEKYRDKSFEYMFKNHKNILSIITILISDIMDYYTLVKALNSKKNVIINAGLNHTSNVLYHLIKLGYIKEYENGVNIINNSMLNSPNCVLVDKI